MGSQRLLVTHNVAAYNDDHGLLFRDIQKCEIRENRLEHNGEGMFFYSSTENLIADNRVADNEVGAKIWAGSKRNRVTGNAFVGNRRQIFYVSTEDLEWGVEQPGNRWGDYLGWDQDGDGIGDRPYRVDSFTTNLLHRYPSAVLLIRSPALELLTHMEGRMPLLRVPTVIDRRPQLRGAGG
jgi:nitrous oxidase accessory protein